MKKKEIKKMTKSQALKDIDKFKKDLFNFRFQKINSQITNASKIKETKKNKSTPNHPPLKKLFTKHQQNYQ